MTRASFGSSRIPALSLCAIPRWDIQYLKAMATYGDGFLGRPPEFDMMMGQMEVSTTMHGGYRDHPITIGIRGHEPDIWIS